MESELLSSETVARESCCCCRKCRKYFPNPENLVMPPRLLATTKVHATKQHSLFFTLLENLEVLVVKEAEKPPPLLLLLLGSGTRGGTRIAATPFLAIAVGSSAPAKEHFLPCTSARHYCDGIARRGFFFFFSPCGQRMLSGRKKALAKNSGSALSHVVVQMSGDERVFPVHFCTYPSVLQCFWGHLKSILITYSMTTIKNRRVQICLLGRVGKACQPWMGSKNSAGHMSW